MTLIDEEVVQLFFRIEAAPSPARVACRDRICRALLGPDIWARSCVGSAPIVLAKPTRSLSPSRSDNCKGPLAHKQVTREISSNWPLPTRRIVGAPAAASA